MERLGGTTSAETQGTETHSSTDKSEKNCERSQTQNVIGYHLSHPGQVSLCDKDEHGILVRVKGGSDKGGQEEG